MAGGHALLEGVPGIGKTLLARAFAAALGVRFARIQFTPDLMPTDVIGTNVFDPATGAFQPDARPDLHPGADGRRDQPHAAQDAVGAARGHAGGAGDDRRHLARARSRASSSSPPRTRSSSRAPTRCRRRSSTASCCASRSALPDADAERRDLPRAPCADELAGWGGTRCRPRPCSREGEAAALRRRPAACTWPTSCSTTCRGSPTAVRRSPHVELGVSPRGALALLEAGRALALAGRTRLRAAGRPQAACWSPAGRIASSCRPSPSSRATRARSVLDDAARAVEVPH